LSQKSAATRKLQIHATKRFGGVSTDSQGSSQQQGLSVFILWTKLLQRVLRPVSISGVTKKLGTAAS
jgi:hypothetical protein